MTVDIDGPNNEVDFSDENYKVHVDSAADELIVEHKSSGDTWVFQNDGTLSLDTASFQDGNYQIHTAANGTDVVLENTNTSNVWTFEDDGTLDLKILDAEEAIHQVADDVVIFGNGRHGGSDLADDFNKARSQHGVTKIAYRAVPGQHNISTVFDLTQIEGGWEFVLDLRGASITATDGTMDKVLDITGTAAIDIYGGRFNGPSAVTPDTCFYWARDSDGNPASRNNVHGTKVEGYWAEAVTYHYSAELNNFWGVEFENSEDGSRTVYASDDNVLGISSTHSTEDSTPGPMNELKFFGGIIGFKGTTGSNVVMRQGGNTASGKHRFYSVYVPSTGDAVFEIDIASAGGQVEHVTIQEPVATDINATHFIHADDPGAEETVENWHLSGGTVITTGNEINLPSNILMSEWTIEQSMMFEGKNGFDIYGIRNSDITMGPGLTLNVSQGIIGSVIRMDQESNATISGSRNGAELYFYSDGHKKDYNSAQYYGEQKYNKNPLIGLRNISSPTAGDLTQGEWAWDSTNSRWLFKDYSGTVHYITPDGTL